MNKKLTIFERAFDHLSSIPYLKKIMKSMWWFQVFLTPAICLFGFFQKGLEAFKEPAMTKMILGYAFGMIVFGYMFHRWDQRDKERASSSRSRINF